MCHKADEETVVPCVFVWWDALWHEGKNQFVEREANYWYWEDLHTQKCGPDWDETTLSNRFNAVKRAALFLQRATAIHCNQDQWSVGKSEQLTPTWLQHATFWSGVRRATIAPRSRCTVFFLGYVSEQNNFEIIEKTIKCRKKDYFKLTWF